jgi:hypothetical protein
MKEEGHINVTNVTKHSPRAMISPGIGVFILEKNHSIVTNVTKHLPGTVISFIIGVVIFPIKEKADFPVADIRCSAAIYDECHLIAEPVLSTVIFR